MNVLVTGGAGFIGSHTVRALLARGDQVTVLDDLSTGNLARVPARVRLIQGDVREARLLADGLDQVTHVLHLAAIPSVARSVREPLPSHEVNVTGTARLLEACRSAGVRRVVVASSSSVYGNGAEPGPRHEDLPPRPASPYAATKLAAEAYVLAWSRCYPIDAVALRYFNVFGPGQEPTGEYAAVVPRFVTAALAGRPLCVYGDGLQTRDFTFVENVVAANLGALDGPGGNGQALNVASGRAVSLSQLIARIGEILGRTLEVAHQGPRPGDVRHSLAAVARARDAIGYVPRITFEEGLLRTIQSFAPVEQAT